MIISEFLTNMNQYHWLTFGFVLVAFEIFGLAGFMLGFAIAAVIVAIFLSFVPLSWETQWITFSILSLVSSVIWYLLQAKRDKADDQTTTLNKKENQFIGQKVTLEDDLPVGKGRMKMADSTWSVYSEEKFSKGDVVEVFKVEGIVLFIRKVQ